MVFGKRPGKFSLVHFKWKTSHWVIKIKFKLLKIIKPPVKEEVTFNWHWVGATLIETLFVSCRPSFSPGVSWGREKILEKGDKISRVFNGLWSLSEIILAMEMLSHSRIEMPIPFKVKCESLWRD